MRTALYALFGPPSNPFGGFETWSGSTKRLCSAAFSVGPGTSFRAHERAPDVGYEYDGQSAKSSKPMAELINLNKARKKKVRADAEQQAVQNRVRFGRTKTQRLNEEAQINDAQQKLDQLKREPEPDA